MSSAQIIKYTVGAYQTNVYLVYDEDTKDAFVVDPGYDFPQIYRDVEKLHLDVLYIFLTHGHGDHTGGLEYMRHTFPDALVVASKKEKKFLYSRDMSMGKGGITADIETADGDVFKVGGLDLKIISTPGHTPGGMCILMDKVLFSGDTLFQGSVGRCDLPGGDEALLISSIKDKLMVLADDVRVFPGHMGDTTIGLEKTLNPFIW